jgi:Domain of unknown function (DUF3482)/50S ribosome-binding GTPase
VAIRFLDDRVSEEQPKNKSVPISVRLSLVSHTNVGKTTLARTLLRRDIGEVRDEAHVTEVAERHTLIESPQGDTLVLWDTPGFGDSARLLRRLEQSGNPLGWFLTQVWDRYTDRPFWSSQQAARNVRDHADVVLYLVNAAEDPAAAGYVDPEMRILGWIGKPVLVLLNQLGPPRPADAEAADVAAWTRHLSGHAIVRRVLAFDAFARCWAQEHGLLDAIATLLPETAEPAFGRITAAWRERNLATFEASITVLARGLAATAAAAEHVAERSLAASARDWITQLAAGERTDPALERAMTSLATGLDREVRAATDELIALHGLSGRAAAEILERMGRDVDVDRAADASRAGVLGAALTGALGGLAADLAAGGLTFGAGALIGGVLGAASMRGLARAYNLARGSDATTVRWSAQFLTGRATAAAMRYLAIAHFGRGRGDFVQAEYPAHWHGIVTAAVDARRATLAAIWSSAAAGIPREELAARLEPLIGDVLRECLATLYPGARDILRGAHGPESIDHAGVEVDA